MARRNEEDLEKRGLDAGTGRINDESRRLVSSCDPRLRTFVQASGDQERSDALDALVAAEVRPTVRQVIARRHSAVSLLGAGAEEDIAATVLVRLLRRMQTMLVFEEDAIAQLDDYVATLTYNVIYDFLRRRFPQRTRLRNQLRYILQHDPRFLIRVVNDELICGLRSWGEVTPLQSGAGFSWHNLSAGAFDRTRPGEALETILTSLGSPAAFEALQSAVADLWNVSDRQSSDALPFLTDPRRSQHDQLESRDSLAAVWSEIVTLPEPQRTAILLNLRDPDGHNAAAEIILLGIATFDDLARVAGLTPERLEALWNDLPLCDLEIAAMLGLSRQQVINLRSAGRRRLGRRIRQHSVEGGGQKHGKRASDDE